jgi:hypothetical protein
MVVKKKISKKPSTEVTANALSVNQPADFYNGIVDLVAYNKARDKFISKAPKKRGKVVRSAAKISTYEQLIFTEFNTTLPASEAPFLEYIKGHLNSQDELERSIDEFQFVGAQITGHIQAAYTGLYSTGWNDGRATLGAYEVLEIDTLSYSTEYAANWAAKNAADLVKLIDDNTKSMIKEAIRAEVAQATRNGETWEQLQARLIDTLRGNYAFNEKRCGVIARTESGVAYNRGACECWLESGMVQYVDVFDGDGCLVCSKVNGQVWTIQQAMANPSQHPNCVREFYPRIKAA